MDAARNFGDAAYQAFVTFPVSALTIPRQQDLPSSQSEMPSRSEHDRPSSFTIKDGLYEYFQSSDSVSSRLAQDPHLTPGDAWKKLYGHHNPNPGHDIRAIGKGTVTSDELKKTSLCGKWGDHQPSGLFMRMYHDALCTLNHNLTLGMVSPSLMGSSGVMPLTIISVQVIPDIVRHMSNLIVRAEKEVFLATNFWQNSDASKYITNAIKELSRRAGERGTKIVMKVIYDRGSPRQLLEPHYIVPESEYTGKAVALPASHEIPNIDLQVMNYHHPVLGTFHAKYMVVDRRIGVLQSNNIQDNDNLEMMVHLEGPIVDGLYDMALLSWHKCLQPNLPCLDSPAAAAFAKGDKVSFTEDHARIFTPQGTLKDHAAIIDPKMMPHRAAYGLEAAKPSQERHKSLHVQFGGNTTARGDTNEPSKDHQRKDSKFSYLDDIANSPDRSPRDDPPPSKLPEHTTKHPHYDPDIAAEVLRVQAAMASRANAAENGNRSPVAAVTRHLNNTLSSNASFVGDAPACEPVDEMTPLIPHPAHAAVPMALVCRAPYGPPNHRSVGNPQNAAWLSALRNATKNVFIQTPTLNAEPLVPAIAEACERGIDVYCYVCLGYNDAGELLPMQGGHNEGIAHRLATHLSPAARQRLHWHWYVAKDMTRPVIAESKHRSCHIKLMIVDEHIGIIGNGNQDTQSWFHSQEINVMLDSENICRAWIEGLRRNQNTGLYGAVSTEDGVWRDSEGKEAEGAMGVSAGRFSWAKGLMGAVKRVQGTGGF
ncbi:hypothetical protein F5Y15DRAFT_410728 [Xylariaceae sp. FL0016]|nr:hypothetical protein F5Y15DRAFT_410728 [Xylariaceae sp. FL0016]